MNARMEWIKQTALGLMTSATEAALSMNERMVNVKATAFNLAISTGETISQVASVLGQTAAYIFSPAQIAKDLVRVWEGFSIPLDPSIVSTLSNSPRTRNLLFKTIVINTYHLSSVILCRFLVDKAVENLPYNKGGYYVGAMLDLAACIYLTEKILFSVAIDNAFYNTALAKIAFEEKPAGDTFKSCGCDAKTYAQAAVASPIYYTFGILTTKAIKALVNTQLDTGNLLDWILLPPIAGRAAVYEYAYTVKVKHCTKHLYAELAKGNLESFGVGLALQMGVKIAGGFIQEMTGVNHWSVDYVLASLLFQHFTVLATKIKSPFKGPAGVDPTYPYRLLTEAGIRKSVDVVSRQLVNVKDQNIWALIEKIAQFPPLHMLRQHALDGDLMSKQQILVRDSVLLYFQLFENDIRAYADGIKEKQSAPYSWAASLIPDSFIQSNIVSNMINPNKLRILKLINQQEHLSHPDALVKFVEEARRIQLDHLQGRSAEESAGEFLLRYYIRVITRLGLRPLPPINENQEWEIVQPVMPHLLTEALTVSAPNLLAISDAPSISAINVPTEPANHLATNKTESAGVPAPNAMPAAAAAPEPVLAPSSEFVEIDRGGIEATMAAESIINSMKSYLKSTPGLFGVSINNRHHDDLAKTIIDQCRNIVKNPEPKTGAQKIRELKNILASKKEMLVRQNATKGEMFERLNDLLGALPVIPDPVIVNEAGPSVAPKPRRRRR